MTQLLQLHLTTKITKNTEKSTLYVIYIFG